eukprot:TRINITY_DN8999_c0_g1_i1.p2 TRINITY_DN8999_c0_g1~~TRINITY_DN8999_c0_g1_i1.p2  ORF type:complete len:52 (+),score=4.65 TRINITY_DN8999_c0_g1_i1:27-182(+)
MVPSRRERAITSRATNDAENQDTHHMDEAAQTEQPEIQSPADVMTGVKWIV